jgi:hypothetical protein
MWDDLFRAAAGDDNAMEAQAQAMEMNPRKHHPTSRDSESRRRKKKKARHNKDGHKPSQELLDRILQSRTDPIDEQIWSKLPKWLSPGSSLCNATLCRGWEQDNDCLLTSKCRNCKRSVLYHSLVLSPSVARKRSSVRTVLTAFALVRDIRCCCSCFLMEFYGLNGDRANDAGIEEYINVALARSNELARMSFSSILVPGEADIMHEKVHKVQTAAIALRERIRQLPQGTREPKTTFEPGGIFDTIVSLIICCDAAYFRMYYLQNSANLPIENETVFLPHPPTYFGSKNVAWEVCDHTTDLMNSMREKNRDNIGAERWNCLIQELGIAPPSRESDSLSFMQRNRLSESILLFRKRGWIHSKQAKRQFLKSIKHSITSTSRDPETLFYAAHETPAPPILKEWRDSCRDFLCTLYAYATISPRMIDELKGILRKESISDKNIVEIGAGTGYVANLLVKAGFIVTAFDVAPTKRGDASNEYHGSSPPFCHVEYADSGNFQSAFRQRKAKETALLLCYPPPLSDMAEASLKSFVNLGGRTVIYVGEFSGLTGSSKFEHFLSGHFDFKYRRRCLNWGSDAAELTVWTKSEHREQQSQRNLVQCSGCKNLVPTRRFRMCRPLSYCTETCFDAHKVERGLHFAFNMIPEVLNSKSFGRCEKEKYFEPIPYKDKL